MKKMHFSAGAILSLLGMGIACLPVQAQGDKKITFEDHILPILEAKCLNCHNPDEAKGGLDLSTYSAMMSGGSGGDVVTAQDAAGSRIYSLMAHTEEPFMPPRKPKAPDAELKLIADWINGGILETKSSTAKKSDKPKLDMNITATIGKPEGPPPMPEHLILEPEVVTARPNAVPALAHSPWAPILAVAGQKQVLLYHSEDFDLLGVLPYPEGFPQALNFSSNGAYLSCGGGRGGKSGNVVAWDIKTGERVIEVGKEFDIVLGADISPDLKNVILGGPGRTIKIWDTVAGEQISSIKKHPDWMLTAAYSPDGVIFATGGRNSGLYVWESATGYEFYTLKGHTKAVTSLDWRPDGNVLASASEDGQIILWEMNEGKEVKKWNAHSGGALAVAFAPDGTIASVGRDKNVKLWKADGTAIRAIPASDDIVMSVAFSQDSKRVFTGDWTGKIKVWNVADGKEMALIAPNPPSIEAQLAYSNKRITDLTTKIPELEKGVEHVSQELAAARTKAGEINKVIGEQTKLRDTHKAKVAQLQGQLKTITDQRNQAQNLVNQRNAVVKQRTDALNNDNKALTQHQNEVTKWTRELQKREVTLKATLDAMNAAKTEAAKPALNPEQQKALAALQSARVPLDQAKKAADGNLSTKTAAQNNANTQLQAARQALNTANQALGKHRTARDQALQNLNAANTAKQQADARVVEASKEGKTPAPELLQAQQAANQTQTTAQNAYNAANQQFVASETDAKNKTAKVTTLTAASQKAATEIDAARKDQAAKTQALAAHDTKTKPLLDAERQGKERVAKAQADLKAKTTAHTNASNDRNAHKAKLDGSNRNLTAAKAKVDASGKTLATAQAEAKKATDDLAAKNKGISDTNTAIAASAAEQKKAEALLAQTLPQKEAADKAVAAVVAKEAAAKQNFEVAKNDLKNSEFLVKKWTAAAINLEAHEEAEDMEDMEVELGDMIEDETVAKDTKSKATQARVEAEKTLATAKKTVAEGNQKLASTTTSVLERALQLVSDRAIAKAKEDAIEEVASIESPETTALAEGATETAAASTESGTTSTAVGKLANPLIALVEQDDLVEKEEEKKIEVAKEEALANQNPDEVKSEIASLKDRLASLQTFLKSSYVEADKTKATVDQATQVAAKTPSVIDTRSAEEKAAAKALADAEAERKRQEAQLAEQKALVEELRRKYLQSVPKRAE